MATVSGLTTAGITFNNAQTASVNFYLSAGSNLTVNGANDATSRNVTLDEAMAFDFVEFYVFGTVTGLIPAAIRYDMRDLAFVAIHTGTGIETVDVLKTGGLYNVPVTVADHSSTTTVNLGNNGDTSGIQANLTVTNTALSGTTININDWANTASHNVTLDTVAVFGAPSLYGTITNLATGSISYRTSGVRGVNLWTGTGAQTINVRSAAVPLSNNARSPSAINFGSNGSMNRITAPVTVSEFLSTGGATLTLDDSTDPVNRTVNFSSANRSWYDALRKKHDGYVITGLAPSTIYYDTPSVGSVVLHTGAGTEMVNVRTFAVPNFQVMAHSNNTTINVGVGNVQNVHTSLHVNGAVMSNGAWAQPHLMVDDSADMSRQNLTVVPVFLPAVVNSSYSFLPPNFLVPTQMIAGFTGLTIFSSAFADMTSIVMKTGTGGATVTGSAVAPTILTGSPAASNTLNSGAGTWTLSGPNAGRIGALSFTGFSNLNGNSGNDTFVFQKGASVSGTLNGGGGNDTLDYTSFAGNVLVNLQTSRATGVAHLAGSFGTVIGASGGAAGVSNILVGDGGILKGGNGRRNLLIAGSKSSTLIGGDNQDILIGGSTIYDQRIDPAALIAIMKEWSRSDEGYALRVAHLTKGVGFPHLNRTTVTSNHAGNVLTGGAGLDWFFANQATDTTDKLSSELLVSL